MYEETTYEHILERMLNNSLERNPDVDTREGSTLFYSAAPAAVEFQNVYIGLDTILNETYADTANRVYLIKRCADRRIYPKSASKAVLRGEFNIDVPVGSRYSLGLLDYIVTEKISSGVYKLECETAGTTGNEYLGKLIPIEYIDGLTGAVLTEVLIPGEDEEETEHLRQRYINSFKAQAFGGNVADYKEKISAIDGVGGVKVYRAWKGGGTVKLEIIDSQYSKPSDVMIDFVQSIIDPVQNHGEGLGLAPIGHSVTVCGVEESTVDISTNITYKAGRTWEDTEENVKAVIDSYFQELCRGWADSETLIVRISQIESRLLGLNGIVDIGDTKINGESKNLVLNENTIPKRGEISGEAIN